MTPSSGKNPEECCEETQRVFASTSSSNCDKENKAQVYKTETSRKRKGLCLKKTAQKRKVLMECERTNRFAVPVNSQEIEKVSKGWCPVTRKLAQGGL